ncbi:MAG: hypothetical protein QW115_02210 [Thermoplasmata archaeon]
MKQIRDRENPETNAFWLESTSQPPSVVPTCQALHNPSRAVKRKIKEIPFISQWTASGLHVFLGN